LPDFNLNERVANGANAYQLPQILPQTGEEAVRDESNGHYGEELTHSVVTLLSAMRNLMTSVEHANQPVEDEAENDVDVD